MNTVTQAQNKAPLGGKKSILHNVELLKKQRNQNNSLSNWPKYQSSKRTAFKGIKQQRSHYQVSIIKKIKSISTL